MTETSRFIVRPVPGLIARMTPAERLSLFGRPDIPADGDWTYRPPRPPQSVRAPERSDPDPLPIPEPEPSDKHDRSSRDQDLPVLRRGPDPHDGPGVRPPGVWRAGGGGDDGGLVLQETRRQPGDAGDVHQVLPGGVRMDGPARPDPGPLPSAYGPTESFCRWCGEEVRVLVGNRHFRIWATVAERHATCPGRPFHFPVAQLGLTWYVTQADATRRPIYVRLQFDPEGRRLR